MTGHRHLVERIHAQAAPLVLAVTGGGTGAIAELLTAPEASATVLEAVVPHSPAALCDWLGGRPDQACSERTARAMAMASFERARALGDADPRAIRGIGVTASLAANRRKRGAHRIHAAWQSADATVVISQELAQGKRTRQEEEEFATAMVLSSVAEACGVSDPMPKSPATDADPPRRRREMRAPPEWVELLLGERPAVAVDELVQTHDRAGPPVAWAHTKVVFPGAFNPVHAGHERMARIAAARCDGSVTWEVSIANVDKPALDFIEIGDRLAGLAGRRVLLTRAATFVAKAELLPGCTFVVGADTVARIADARYYGDDPSRRDQAIGAIARQGCRFVVFGRKIGETFHTLDTLPLPAGLRAICEAVDEQEFRHDVASSCIRVHDQAELPPENGDAD